MAVDKQRVIGEVGAQSLSGEIFAIVEANYLRRTTYKTDKDATDGKISAIETADSDLSGRVSTNETDIADLKSADTKLGDRITTLETSSTDVSQEISDLKAADTELSNRITDIEDADYGSKISALEKVDTGYATRISDLETFETNATSRIDALETADSGLDSRITAIEGKKYDDQITALKSADTALDGRVGTLETAKTTIDGEITKLKAADTDLGNRITELEEATVDTYDATSSAPVSGKAVSAAIGTLDVTEITAAANKTVASISETDGKIAVTTQDIAITKSQVTDFPDLAAVATSGKYEDLTGTPTIPTTLPASDTTSTYSATGTAPVNGTAVNAALGTLDVAAVTPGAGQTIASISETDGKIAVTTQDIEITKSQVSDFPTLADVATSGSYNDLSDTPTIPTSLPASDTTSTYSATGSAPVNGKAVSAALGTLDVAAVTPGAGQTIASISETDGKISVTTQDIVISKSQVTDFPTLADVATSGSYNDLSDTPAIPTVNNGKLSIQQNGTELNTFTANSASDVTVDIIVPTKVSDLTNDSGFTDNKGTITGVSVNGTSVATSGAANITSIPGSIINGAIKNGVTAATQASGDNSTKLATTAYVDGAISDLPSPMVFKGSLGTDGTITALPTASAANEGWTYKVITAGTYASIAADVGDTFISDGSAWVLIPSGDEPSGTVTSVTLKASGPISIDSSSAITTSGTRTISHANSGATAGTYGDSAAQAPSYGATFKVPTLTVNATGHVTAVSEHTVTIPASDNVNTTYSLTQDSTDGHKITLTPSSGTAQTITIPDTDTVTTVEVTGSGNAITAISATNGAITATKGTTFATPANITSAIGALDVAAVTPGAGQTIASISETDGKIAVTTQDISITKSQVSDFPALAAVATSGAYSDLTGTPTIPTSLPASNTTNSYSASGTAPVSGKAVAAALGTLDVAAVTPGAGQTIASISETDGKIAVTTQDIEITKSQVSDFPALAAVATSGAYSDLTGTPSSLPASNTTDTYSSTGTAPVSGKAVASAIAALDVASAGGSGKFIQAISETDGKISATVGTMPTSLPASNTTSSYSSTGTAPVNGKAVAAALGTLDVDAVTPTAAQTIASISETDGKIAVTTQAISITVSQVSDFPTLAAVATSGAYSDLSGTPTIPTSLPASDTVSTYSSTGTAPVNGKAVAAALGTLDVSSVGGSGKYIQAISETDGKISATAADLATEINSVFTNNYTFSVEDGYLYVTIS